MCRPASGDAPGAAAGSTCRGASWPRPADGGAGDRRAGRPARSGPGAPKRRSRQRRRLPGATVRWQGQPSPGGGALEEGDVVAGLGRCQRPASSRTLSRHGSVERRPARAGRRRRVAPVVRHQAVAGRERKRPIGGRQPIEPSLPARSGRRRWARRPPGAARPGRRRG